MENDKNISLRIPRREFLQLSGLSIASLFLPSFQKQESAVFETIEPIELVGVSESEGFLKSKNLEILEVPLHKDYFYDENRPLRILRFEEGQIFSFKNVYTVRKQKELLKYTILPHLTGEESLYIALLERDSEIKFQKETPQNYYEELVEQILSAYTYIDDVYPNKILNILTAVESITSFQDKNGPFQPNVEYSLLEILNLSERGKYRVGLTSSRTEVIGGGVCALASTLAKSLHLLNARFTERWQHPTPFRYFVGPGDARITKGNSDTTVSVESNENIYDFKWQMPETAPFFYLTPSASIILNGKSEVSDVGKEADAMLIMTLAWTNEPSSGNPNKVKYLRDSYDDFRKSGVSSQILRSSAFLDSVPFGSQGDMEETARKIFPEERRQNFEEDLSTNPWLRTIKTLTDIINSYSDTHSPEDVRLGIKEKLGDYLKKSSWYLNLENKDTIEPGLRHLNWNTYLIDREAIQCIGWVVLLAFINEPQSPKNISGQLVSNAHELVPKEIVQRTKKLVSSGGLLFRTLEDISEVDIGDLFVRYDTQAGHVGLVVGKKLISGKTVLLVSDANRKRDGIVRLFEVDENNFNAVFGEYPYQKILVKKYSTN